MELVVHAEAVHRDRAGLRGGLGVSHDPSLHPPQHRSSGLATGGAFKGSAACSPATSAARVVGVDSRALFNRVPTVSQ
jgi:hypothetical protein